MKVAIIGASGALGQRVLAEAIERGHQVSAYSRRGLRSSSGVPVGAVDAREADEVAQIAGEHDLVIGCARPPVGDESLVVPISTGLLDGCARSQTPLLLVGGSGSLRSPNDRQLPAAEDPAVVPPKWRPIARACLAQWELCRSHPWQGWTHACPPAQLAPGRRTGDYVRGRDTVLVARDGTSAISMEDFAVAILDEVEQPRATGDRFTVVAATVEQTSAQNASAEEDAGVPAEPGVDR